MCRQGNSPCPLQEDCTRAGPTETLPPSYAAAAQPACPSHPLCHLLTVHRCNYLLPLLPARPSAAPPQRRLGQAAGASGAELHGHAAIERHRAE